jgi:hypothetical protein
MHNPRNKHGTDKCVPRDINGNRAGPLINVHFRSRAPTVGVLCEGEIWFFTGGGRIMSD